MATRKVYANLEVGELAMACSQCMSNNLSVFPAEVNIHFPGIADLDKPSVWVFPSLVVCLDCGLAQFRLSLDQSQRLEKRNGRPHQDETSAEAA